MADVTKTVVANLARAAPTNNGGRRRKATEPRPDGPVLYDYQMFLRTAPEERRVRLHRLRLPEAQEQRIAVAVRESFDHAYANELFRTLLGPDECDQYPARLELFRGIFCKSLYSKVLREGNLAHFTNEELRQFGRFDLIREEFWNRLADDTVKVDEVRFRMLRKLCDPRVMGISGTDPRLEIDALAAVTQQQQQQQQQQRVRVNNHVEQQRFVANQAQQEAARKSLREQHLFGLSADEVKIDSLAYVDRPQNARALYFLRELGRVDTELLRGVLESTQQLAPQFRLWLKVAQQGLASSPIRDPAHPWYQLTAQMNVEAMLCDHRVASVLSTLGVVLHDSPVVVAAAAAAAVDATTKKRPRRNAQAATYLTHPLILGDTRSTTQREVDMFMTTTCASGLQTSERPFIHPEIYYFIANTVLHFEISSLAWDPTDAEQIAEHGHAAHYPLRIPGCKRFWCAITGRPINSVYDGYYIKAIFEHTPPVTYVVHAQTPLNQHRRLRALKVGVPAQTVVLNNPLLGLDFAFPDYQNEHIRLSDQRRQQQQKSLPPPADTSSQDAEEEQAAVTAVEMGDAADYFSGLDDEPLAATPVLTKPVQKPQQQANGVHKQQQQQQPLQFSRGPTVVTATPPGGPRSQKWVPRGAVPTTPPPQQQSQSQLAATPKAVPSVTSEKIQKSSAAQALAVIPPEAQTKPTRKTSERATKTQAKNRIDVLDRIERGEIEVPKTDYRVGDMKLTQETIDEYELMMDDFVRSFRNKMLKSIDCFIPGFSHLHKKMKRDVEADDEEGRPHMAAATAASSSATAKPAAAVAAAAVAGKKTGAAAKKTDGGKKRKTADDECRSDDEGSDGEDAQIVNDAIIEDVVDGFLADDDDDSQAEDLCSEEEIVQFKRKRVQAAAKRKRALSVVIEEGEQQEPVLYCKAESLVPVGYALVTECEGMADVIATVLQKQLVVEALMRLELGIELNDMSGWWQKFKEEWILTVAEDLELKFEEQRRLANNDLPPELNSAHEMYDAVSAVARKRVDQKAFVKIREAKWIMRALAQVKSVLRVIFLTEKELDAEMRGTEEVRPWVETENMDEWYSIAWKLHPGALPFISAILNSKFVRLQNAIGEPLPTLSPADLKAMQAGDNNAGLKKRCAKYRDSVMERFADLSAMARVILLFLFEWVEGGNPVDAAIDDELYDKLEAEFNRKRAEKAAAARKRLAKKKKKPKKKKKAAEKADEDATTDDDEDEEEEEEDSDDEDNAEYVEGGDDDGDDDETNDETDDAMEVDDGEEEEEEEEDDDEDEDDEDE